MDKRIGLISAGAAIALAAVAGCGTGSSANSGGSAARSLQLSPAAYIKATLSKTSGVKTVHVDGTITAAGADLKLDGQEQFGNKVQLSLNLSVAGQSLSEILIGDTFYMKVPQLASGLGGKPWAKFSLSSLGSLGSTFKSLIDSAKNTDPSVQLQPLLASGDVHKVGTETVDGVQADHYSGTLDPATAFDSLQAKGNLTPDQIAQLKSLTKAGGVTDETIDVWVAPDSNLPVRLVSSADSTAGTVKVDLHLSDWGKPVSITAPPADQVGDLSSLLNGSSGLGSGSV
jgi:hypothetical protein